MARLSFPLLVFPQAVARGAQERQPGPACCSRQQQHPFRGAVLLAGRARSLEPLLGPNPSTLATCWSPFSESQAPLIQLRGD